MNRKKINRNVGITVLLIIVFGCLFFFFILPMMILPPYPLDLFIISNHDDLNHIVDVEIFNSKNIPIFSESYHVEPDDFIEIDRGFDWCPKSRFYWISWDVISCTFNVSLDNTYNVSHYTELGPLGSVWITINKDNKNPLEVGEVAI